ncbi:hypothetical protein [Methanosphaera sp.]|uniref:hypothetical protein n=1 Tax=Methanosphaera sp. TaxID=2666342 RepID=UPI0025CF6888|nr:hypothetical protein [Methanosphaera sp.]MEE1117201.1 hypothetical protein [Methanosphaera sp.]MEE3417925.1 hypothetical protein [Methanosphaera sp.]
MSENNETNNYKDNITSYDFLDLSYDSISGLTYGKKLGGKRGISFETNPEKYQQLIEKSKSDKKLAKHKIINQNPLNIKINKMNKEQFDFTVCIDTTSGLNGIDETKILLEKSLRLSKKFVYISQVNFDSDVVLFKKGFKTNYSDWSRKINHLTSNIFFNILFDFYKRGFIEDFLIYYTIPIKNSKDPIIHPLNSPKNQPNFNEESHPSKNENIKFKNIYRNINVLITKNGYKKIDDILESTKKDNHILYDSRTGIYDDSTEKFKDKTNFKSESIIGKVNKYLNSDI